MKLWRLYFWFIAAVMACALWRTIVMPMFMDVVALIISAIALVGLYGFCFDKKIGSRNLWKVAFLVYLFEDVIYYLLRMHARSAHMGLFFLIVVYGITFLINLPGYVAMYLYAFKRNDVWENPLVKKE